MLLCYWAVQPESTLTRVLPFTDPAFIGRSLRAAVLLCASPAECRVACGGQTMQVWAQAFYKSAAWKHCSEYIRRRDAYLCVDCLRKGKLTPSEEVHHITELTPQNINDPRITLNADNLVSLCRECHKARHGARHRRYKTDELGRVYFAD